MFLVNSRLGLVAAAGYNPAPLLPKLRGHFAEFLRESYLAPLSILYLPTCVGSGYRYIKISGAFAKAVQAFLENIVKI